MRKFFIEKDPRKRKKLLRGYNDNARRNMMFEARKKAQKCIAWLVFLTENMPNVTDNPAKEYSRIFTPETVGKLKIVNKAINMGLLHTGEKLVLPDQVWKLSIALRNEGIEHDMYKLLKDKDYRNKMWRKLFPRDKVRKIKEEIERQSHDLSDMDYERFKAVFGIDSQVSSAAGAEAGAFLKHERPKLQTE
jgi:hypothetical protein